MAAGSVNAGTRPPTGWLGSRYDPRMSSIPSRTTPLAPGEAVSTVQSLLRSRAMLQWQSELDAFCAFMAANRVRSFLEIGAATGRLSLHLKDTLALDKVAACDMWHSPLLKAAKVEFFHGDHHDPAYPAWRAQLGHIDMVFIDADHETGFRRDYEIERAFPHSFIGFHDIANKIYPALSQFWEEDVVGEKHTFINTDTSLRFGVPPIAFPFASWPTFEALVADCGYACGIGVVKA